MAETGDDPRALAVGEWLASVRDHVPAETVERVRRAWASPRQLDTPPPVLCLVLLGLTLERFERTADAGVRLLGLIDAAYRLGREDEREHLEQAFDPPRDG